MNGYLLDTNVLSEAMKKRPSAAVLARFGALPYLQSFTSTVCIMELRFGARRDRRARALWERIEREILSRVRVVPFGASASLRAGELLAELETIGSPIGVEDVMIGATALEHDLVLVARNVRHFGRIHGLRVENWWD